MYSQAILIKKLILTLLCLSLMACGSSKEFGVPEKIKDTKPPTIEDFQPNEDISIDFEVDTKVEVLFSELMDLDSLISEEGVKLFSGRRERDLSQELDLEPREALLYFSIVPVESRDLFTDNIIQIPATKLRLTHASGRFALNTSYTVTVDHPARDLVEDDLKTPDIDERNYISTSAGVDFTTEKGDWKEYKDPDDGSLRRSKAIPNISVASPGTPQQAPVRRDENQFSPTLVSNKKGDSFLLWRQEISPGINQLWASRYNINEQLWSDLDKAEQVCSALLCSNSIQINADNTTNVVEYDVSINDEGQLAVVWSQLDQVSGFVSIWAKLYDGNNWLEITDIAKTGFSARSGDADSPQVEIDKNGNVVSIWRQYENNKAVSRIKTNIYKLDNGALLMSDGQWIEAPTYIDNTPQALSRPPTLEMNSSGLAIAVWGQKTSSHYYVFSNHLRLNQAVDWDWVNPTRIDFNSEILDAESSLPTVAIDDNGDAIAIWLKHDGQIHNLWYSRFVGSWTQAGFVEVNRLGDVSYPIITFSQDSRALLAWVQENKVTNSKKLVSAFFDVNQPSGGWSKENEVASGMFLSKPAAAFDREGNAVLLWQEDLTKGNINSSYYSAITNNWEPSINLSSSGNDISVNPLFEDGRFLSVWEEESNSNFKLNSALYSD